VIIPYGFYFVLLFIATFCFSDCLFGKKFGPAYVTQVSDMGLLFSYLTAGTITGDWAVNLDLC
jgi:hypothetical protein